MSVKSDDGFEQDEPNEDQVIQQVEKYSPQITLPEANPLLDPAKCFEIQERLQYKRMNENSLTVYEKYNLNLENCVYIKYDQKNRSKYQKQNHFNTHFFNLEKKAELKNQIFYRDIQTELQGVFTSDFQGGNLYAAFQISPDEYDLLIQNDINTNGYSQWFYFCILNTKKGRKIKLNILNLSRSYHQFSYDNIRILLFYQQNDPEWKLGGNEFQCEKSCIFKPDPFKPHQIKQLYRLCFEIELNYDSDILYLSLNQPYQLEDLKRFIQNKVQVICETFGGNPLYKLAISEGSEEKEIIIVIGRQHPGETVSSFVCQGLIEYFYSTQATSLREKYEIIVFPMLNPDGVNQGNFRCDLSGSDLNRVWSKPNKLYHRHILYLKNYLRDLLRSGRNISFFIDLHGHSRKYGSFIYGCRGDLDAVQCRLFPKIMAKHCKYFNFKDCTFTIETFKQKTARATIFKMLRHYKKNFMQNVFTLETSFFGYRDENMQVRQFIKDDLLNIGRQLGQSLQIYCNKSNSIYIQSIIQELNEQKHEFEAQDKKTFDQSDSEAEYDLMDVDQLVKCEVFTQKKKEVKKFVQNDKKKKSQRRFSEQQGGGEMLQYIKMFQKQNQISDIVQKNGKQFKNLRRNDFSVHDLPNKENLVYHSQKSRLVSANYFWNRTNLINKSSKIIEREERLINYSNQCVTEPSYEEGLKQIFMGNKEKEREKNYVNRKQFQVLPSVQARTNLRPQILTQNSQEEVNHRVNQSFNLEQFQEKSNFGNQMILVAKSIGNSLDRRLLFPIGANKIKRKNTFYLSEENSKLRYIIERDKLKIENEQCNKLVKKIVEQQFQNQKKKNTDQNVQMFPQSVKKQRNFQYPYYLDNNIFSNDHLLKIEEKLIRQKNLKKK